MLEIPDPLLRRLEAHAVEGYPSEVCGLLVGTDGEVRVVSEVKRGVNLLGDSTTDRYIIDPRDILRTDREAREMGLEVLGFYHSHPNHPAAPSAYDVERAWPWYSYLILATTPQGVQAARAWRHEGDGMAEETIQITRDEKEGG